MKGFNLICHLSKNEDGLSKEVFYEFFKSIAFPSQSSCFSPEAKVREAKLELEMKANPSLFLDDI